VSLSATPDAVDIGMWTGMLKLHGVVMQSPGVTASTGAALLTKAAATPVAEPRSAAMFHPSGGVTCDRLSVTALPRPIVAVP